MENQKRRKGRVGVSSHRGRLRLRFPRSIFEGDLKYLYLNLEDNSRNRKIAESKAAQIEAEIFLGQFDYSLERYKSSYVRQKTFEKISLLALYEQYIETKRLTVRPGTWKNGYKVMLGHLQRSPFADVNPNSKNIGYAQKILDWASQKLSPDTCRRLIVQLNACLKWAIKSNRVTLSRSPFEGMATEAKKLIKKTQEEETDINPFTASERDIIIEAFKTHSRYNYYYFYVYFCFYVGCRPSEAIALTWDDISNDLSKITFRNVIVASVEGTKKCKGLKTQSKRVFPCNNQVQELLNQVQLTCQPDQSLVFPSLKGKVFSIAYFRKIWVEVLKNLEIEYRKPYQMRHTFITLCLESGLDAKDVARLVGNSPEIIYQHYAGQKTELSVPKF